MRFLAEQLKIGTQEKIRVEKPGDLTMEYSQAIRVGSVLLLLPLGLMILAMVYVTTGIGGVLVMSAFSLIHVLLLLVLLGVLGALERPMIRLMCWGWWPLHRWWLLHHNPARLKFVVEHTRVERTNDVIIDLDEEQGQLTVGGRTLNIDAECRIHLERSLEPEPRLRILIGARAQRPLVVATPLPEPLPARWREVYHALPRMESDAILLDWPTFCRFARSLRHASASSRETWPSMLDWACEASHIIGGHVAQERSPTIRKRTFR